MLRALLASTLLLFACGGNPPVESPADPDVALADDPTPVPFTGDSKGFGGSNDPCVAAACNDHRERDEYTDPADQRLRLREQESTSVPGAR